MKAQNTTLSEQLQHSIEKSQKETDSIQLTRPLIFVSTSVRK